MSKFRKEKILNHIKELSASYIEKESGNTSIITVTRATISQDNKHATIFITALPENKENAAYGFVKRNLGEIRKSIMKKIQINPVPFIDVEIDKGEKNRQKIEDLLRK